MDKLVGKIVLSLSVSHDQWFLVFDTDEGRITYQTEGDCCSETWFADIVGVKALLGEQVRKVEWVDPENYNVQDGRGRQEHDQAYGVKLFTDKGICDIIFRNSSNGYYGGSIAETAKNPPEDLTAIADDWQA